MLHTILPIEAVWPQQIPARTFRRVGGHLLEGYDTPQGFCVTRLLTTDPALYLDPRYAPGAVHRIFEE